MSGYQAYKRQERANRIRGAVAGFVLIAISMLLLRGALTAMAYWQ
jgi:hypothetical protein